MATGDIRINALVELSRASLATNHTPGTGAVITYSSLSATPNGSGVYDFRGLNDAQKSAVKLMLAEIASIGGITFKEVADGGLLQYGTYTGRPGIPSGPDNKAESVTSSNGSVVWLNWQVVEIANLGSGYGKQLVLHETAHALGLKHPEAYSSYDSGPFLPAGSATAAHTIMAYNGGNTEHLGDYDLLALQYLWGATGSLPTTGSSVSVNSSSTTASYFNDTISLDVNAFNSSTQVNGLAGTDELVINVASTKGSFQPSLQQFTYTKADSSFAGVFLNSVERVRFTDKSVALDIDGNAGQAFRLYNAAFDRTPDKSGLGYWLNQMDNGTSLKAVSQGFVSSNEFVALNGVNPTSTQLATSLYKHVLDRTPDQVGLAYWVGQLDSNSMTRSDVLMGFSESTENQIAVSGQIQGGIEYTPVI